MNSNHEHSTLEQAIKAAWDALEQNAPKNKASFHRRPWIILLGSTNPCKEILPSLVGAEKLAINESKTELTWSHNDKAIWLSVSLDVEINALMDAAKSYHHGYLADHIVLVVTQEELAHFNEKTLKRLTTQLADFQNSAQMIPISILIVESEKIIGFCENFAELSAEAREQIFGVYQPNEFPALINNIESEMIHRLHHEPALIRRQKIYQFPKRLLLLQEKLNRLVNELPFNETLVLNGIYFAGIDERNHYYFYQDALKRIEQQAQQQATPSNRYALGRLITMPITAAIVFGLTWLWHTGYNQTTDFINQTQQALISASDQSNKQLPWLSTIDALKQLKDRENERRFTIMKWAGLPQGKKITNIAQTNYNQLLQSQFIPYLKSTLLAQIQSGLSGNKLALFDALKTYLSIGNKKYYNSNIIKDWFQTYWKAQYDNNAALQTALKANLDELLSNKTLHWKTDPELIKKAQTELKKLSLTELAFLELQGQYPATMVPVFSKGKLDGVDVTQALVPAFFSSRYFKTIYNQDIPNIGKTLAKGNWVLGTLQGSVIDKKQEETIATALRKQYLNYYTSAWAAAINAIKLTPAENFGDLDQRIEMVLHEKSGLNELVRLLLGNASLNDTPLDQQLITIKGFVDQDKKSSYASIKQVLDALQKQINGITTNKTPDKVSFQITLDRFKNNASNDALTAIYTVGKSAPEPIRTWLITIADSAWDILLKQSRSYLNDVWGTIVLPVYHDQIENRYPIFSDSNDDIALQNFTQYFGPNGTVGAFFVYYLQPFVNMSKNYWTWKSLNGKSLAIPQKTLNSFILASIIQQMFFTDDPSKPSFRFILVPQNLSSNAKELTLNVGGQIDRIYSKNNTNQTFNWPGPDPSFVSVQFLSTDDKTSTVNYAGPWAWFRLLGDSNLQATGDPQQFLLSIQAGNHGAHFNLLAEHRINPMVPGVLNRYRSPDKL